MHETNPKLDANLIGYLVGGLDEREHRQVQAELDADPSVRSRLNDLRLALEPLAADKEDAPPPRDLAARTIAVIAEHCCRQLPRAPAPIQQPVASPSRAWWRQADVLVAASLLIAVVGLTVPGVLRLRTAAARLECQNNLRELSNSLHAYRDVRGEFPNIAQHAPHDMAGVFIPILADAGVLSNQASIRCPGNGPPVANAVTLEEVRAMPPDFHRQSGQLTSSYAYSLGYKDENGYHAPCQCEGQPANLVALLSDSPPQDGAAGNSHNHGGNGQNILFIDGSVQYCSTRTVGFQGDDIFLNKAKKIKAGLDCLDNVLGSGASKP